mmetsp:Transcript_64443/g.102568  ORF Transcript_64443/g.102568 Transcript_64443/m.102568 type:complete len:129 (+) Transcript_64443:114-500(+)
MSSKQILRSVPSSVRHFIKSHSMLRGNKIRMNLLRRINVRVKSTHLARRYKPFNDGIQSIATASILKEPPRANPIRSLSGVPLHSARPQGVKKEWVTFGVVTFGACIGSVVYSNLYLFHTLNDEMQIQ